MLQVVGSSESGFSLSGLGSPSGQLEPVANQSSLLLPQSDRHSLTNTVDAIIVNAEEPLREGGSSNQPDAEDSAFPAKKKARTSQKTHRKETLKPFGKRALRLRGQKK
jgi:hypothetical protein